MHKNAIEIPDNEADDQDDGGDQAESEDDLFEVHCVPP